jgi:hypothetical protein
LELANVSLAEKSATFQLSSPTLVLIDPLALDGVSEAVAQIGEAPPSERAGLIPGLPGHLKTGLHTVENFRPGAYALDLDDFEDGGDAEDVGVFSIDSGTVVVIDMDHLADVARNFAWEAWDLVPQDDVSELLGLLTVLARSSQSSWATPKEDLRAMAHIASSQERRAQLNQASRSTNSRVWPGWIRREETGWRRCINAAEVQT